jgi:hypothetical protein
MRLILLLILLWCCSPANAQKELAIKDVSFNGIFGASELDSTTLYCLLGMGYFLAPTSQYIDTVISTWISEHPNAIVKPIYTSGSTFSDEPESKLTYCWVIDGNKNLNIWMVQQGCTNGINMQYPTEQIKKQLGMDKIESKESKEEIHVQQEEYEQFIELAQQATKEAYENKRGIWKDK